MKLYCDVQSGLIIGETDIIFYLRVDTNRSDQNLATALHYVGPGQDHRVDRNPLIHLKRVV